MKRSMSIATIALLLAVGGSGCSGAPAPTSTPAQTQSATPTLAPAPDTTGMALDQARKALEKAGYDVTVTDSRENRSILAEGDWVVTSQEITGPTATLGALMATDKSDEQIAAEQAAADEAARVAQEQQQQQQQAPPAPAPAPAEAYYANCTEAKAAGAAPIHQGSPGYSSKLDRDGDGVACES